MEELEHAQETHMLTILGADELYLIFEIIGKEAAFILAMVCRSFRSIIGSKTKPYFRAFAYTKSILEWALKNGCPNGEKLRSSVAQSASLPAIEWFKTQIHPIHINEFMKDACKYASQHGSNDILEWAVREGLDPCDGDYVNTAARFQQLKTLEWLVGKGCRLTSATWSDAASTGRTEIMEWLRVLICPWDSSCFERAAEGGHLDLLKWLVKHTEQTVPPSETWHAAAANGHLSILEWGHVEHNVKFDQTVWYSPALNNHLFILQWLWSVKYRPDSKAIYYAAQGGHLEILNWLTEMNCPLHSLAVYAAAEHGHLKTLQWLIDKGDKQKRAICEVGLIAIRHGHLDVLKWWQQQCNNTFDTFFNALVGPAGSGYVDVVRFLLANGSKISDAVWRNAAEHGQVEVLALLRENQLSTTKGVCEKAAFNGHLNVLKWARAQNPPFEWSENTCVNAAAYGELHVLKWLREHGCPWDSRVLVVASKNAATDIKEWAENNGLNRTNVLKRKRVEGTRGSENEVPLETIEKS